MGGVGVGQRRENNRVKNREDRDVGADSESESRDGERGKSGSAAERAQGGEEFVKE
jgi:hypothetical protein